MKYQIPGWEVDPATILTFERYNKTIEKVKKCEPNRGMLQENGRMAVNRMRVANGSAEHEPRFFKKSESGCGSHDITMISLIFEPTVWQSRAEAKNGEQEGIRTPGLQLRRLLPYPD